VILKKAIQVWNEGFLEGVRPDPELTVSQWSDEFRILSSSTSSEPGKFRTDRTPYLKKIMDALSATSPYKRIVFMKAAQIGATEAGNNWIGYNIDLNPGPMMAVQPTIEMGKRWSKQRLDSLLEDTPALTDLVKSARSRDSGNTMMMKEYRGGLILVTGANSPVGLRSMPVRDLFLDEVDGYPSESGDEGDPVSIAEKRTATFANKKIYMVSTPTIKGFSRIELEYDCTDQQKFFVPCPICGEFQVLDWNQIKWDKISKDEPDLDSVRYQCKKCRKEFLEYEKTAMLNAGEWRPTSEKPCAPDVIGFHLSSLYSPLGWVSWRDLVDDWYKAQKDTALLKTFMNTRLGRTWEDKGERPDEHVLMSRREEYGAEIPAAGLVLTAGVDVQEDRLEVETVAWGIGQESWSISYDIFHGPTAEENVWLQLDQFLQSKFQHESGVELKIACVCVDTGYQTQKAYNFIKPRQNRRVYGIKGSSLPGVPVVGRPSKKSVAEIKLFPIGTDAAKDVIYGRLGIKDHGPGYMHFPLEYDQEFFDQLTAEKVVTKYVKGYPTRQYVPIRERNETLDCRCYALAAMIILNPVFEKLKENIERKAEELKNGGVAKNGKKKKIPHRKGFVHRWGQA
jgi:phage terminase large subunit GpA-like protein